MTPDAKLRELCDKARSIPNNRTLSVDIAAVLSLLDRLDAQAARIAELEADRDKSERRAITFADAMEQQIIAMQAALIDQSHRGAEFGMRWIENTLFGPGLYPDIGEALAMSKDNPAQAWFDAKIAEHEEFRRQHPAPEGQALSAKLRKSEISKLDDAAIKGAGGLPNGRTVLEHAEQAKLLPALEGPKA